ncbi:MAG: hypothetical protein AAAC47_13160 [Pararhizobium sp.]
MNDEKPLLGPEQLVVKVKVSPGVVVDVEYDITFVDDGEHVEVHCPIGVSGWIVNED